MKSNKILGPIEVIKKYLLLDWVYYFMPFSVCFGYGIFAFEFSSLQMLVNSFFSNIFNLGAAIGIFISLPNVATLIHCQKKVLQDMPKDIILKAASSERSGGAGCGKTSSAVLQAIIEASEMEQSCIINYYYIKANFKRWKAENPLKIKDFYELEKSVTFWREHPEYIPFLASNITIKDANGRKSYYADNEALSQNVWLPACFILIDESGNELPQDMFKERPAGPTMFARYVRHFGFRLTLLEQKLDGIYINVRAVLGVRCLALQQSNKLRPFLLLDILKLLKSRLAVYDPSEYTDKSAKKYAQMQKKFNALGHFCELLESFSNKLGFRVWKQALVPPESASGLIEPEILEIYCTNLMPAFYDEKEFSHLYVASEQDNCVGFDAASAEFPTTKNAKGEHILSVFKKQEEDTKKDDNKRKADCLKAENDLKYESIRSLKLNKQVEKINKV